MAPPLFMDISIDFETFSECDIRKAGAYAYSIHPTTEVLCLSYAIDNEPPTTWLPSHPPPQRLFDLLAEPDSLLWAWNVFFEMSIWHNVLAWPELEWEQWQDTAALAAAQAYPRALEKCGTALGLSSDQAKSKRGKTLIQRLCKPYRGARNNDPLMLQELYDYCEQDVIAERSIRHRLRPLKGIEKDVFKADQEINWRGVRLDKESILNAITIIDRHTKRLNLEVGNITQGALDNTASRAKSLRWINEQGYSLEEYDKNAISNALEDKDCPGHVKEFLKIRQSLSKSSTKKYNSMLDSLGLDNRVHGSLMYHGASTGRWAGRLLNPQNLPRPTIDNVDEVIEQMRVCDPAAISGEPMESLSSCLRGMLIASEGHRLICADYSSIEARVLAWLCDHKTALSTFATGKDIYKFTAASMYKVDYDQVTKDQRFIGKVATLALGYQGGVKAFQRMAGLYGEEFDDREALKVRDDWRDANKPITRLWAAVSRAAKNAISYAPKSFQVAKGEFKYLQGDLLFKLPSKRILSFPKARLVAGKHNSEIVYEGVDNHTHRWGEIRAYGGFLVQSITQAVARDVLAEAILRLEHHGYDVVLHVHDEIVSDVPKKHGSLKQFEKIMCNSPGWAAGLPIEAEGYESDRYRK